MHSLEGGQKLGQYIWAPPFGSLLPLTTIGKTNLWTPGILGNVIP